MQEIKYYIHCYERPFGNEWKLQNTEFYGTESEGRAQFNKMVTLSFNSAEPVKIRFTRNKLKLAEFSLSYPI